MIVTKLEAILFAIAKPISIKKLSKQLDVSQEIIIQSIEDVKIRFNTPESGIHLIEQDGDIQFTTNPVSSKDVALFLKQAESGPLTRPSLEALTVIAYRGPITKPEIEQIRGINCSLIIRNLLIRGLIDEKEDRERLQPVYSLSMKFIKTLGINKISDLPEYESFNSNEQIDNLIEQTNTEDA